MSSYIKFTFAISSPDEFLVVCRHVYPVVMLLVDGTLLSMLYNIMTTLNIRCLWKSMINTFIGIMSIFLKLFLQ